MLYLIIVLASIVSIAGVNSLFSTLSFFDCVNVAFLFAVAVFAIDAVVAIFIRRVLPNSMFDHTKEKYSVSKKECHFYEKLKIRSWKNKVEEWGVFTNFRKNQLSDPKNNAYVERFIMESQYGICIHFYNMFCGVLILFYSASYIGFALPVAIVNAFLHILPYMILRYNLRKLKVLHKMNEKFARRRTELENNEQILVIEEEEEKTQKV